MFGRRRTRKEGEGLVVGPSDVLDGTIAAEAVTVTGRVSGALDVATTLHVASSGHVTGTVRAAHLVVAAGATVRAACRVGPPIPAVERTPSATVPPGVMRLTPRSTRRVDAPKTDGGAAAAHA
jgi:hypothetical protein